MKGDVITPQESYIRQLEAEVDTLRKLMSSFEEQEQDDMAEIKELRRRVVKLGGKI